jgi:hypothetical protein
MPRIKFTVVSVLAVAVVCAVVAGSASAAQETRWFVGGAELTTPETVGGAVGVMQLNSTLLGTKIMIECTANEVVPTGENMVEKEGKAKTELAFKQCYVDTISKGTRELVTSCGIEPIQYKVIEQLVAGPGGLVEDEFKPASGNTLFEIHIVNANGKTCTLKSADKVEGAYVASVGAEGERSMTAHELTVTPSGSRMTLAGAAVSLLLHLRPMQLRSNQEFYA